MPQFFQNISSPISTLNYRFRTSAKNKKGKLYISCRNTGAFSFVHAGLGTDLGTWEVFPLTSSALKDPLFLYSNPLC